MWGHVLPAYLLAQRLRSGDFVAEFLVRLVDGDSGARPGRESAIRIERNPFRGEKSRGLLHAFSNDFGWIDLAGRNAHAAQPDLKIFAQLLEYSHVTGARRGELHRKVMYFKPI